MESVLRGAAIYLMLLVVVRLSGRRSLSQMTPFDLVLIMIVAETTQQALLGDDYSLVNAVVLVVTLFSIDVGLSYVKGWSTRAERWLDGAPTVLISRGQPDRRALDRTRIQIDDVLRAARKQHGLERLDQVKFAVLEIGGEITIVPAD